jgi:hypothetical protein
VTFAEIEYCYARFTQLDMPCQHELKKKKPHHPHAVSVEDMFLYKRQHSEIFDNVSSPFLLSIAGNKAKGFKGLIYLLCKGLQSDVSSPAGKFGVSALFRCDKEMDNDE